MSNYYKFNTRHTQKNIDMILDALKAMPMSRQQVQAVIAVKPLAARRYLDHLREQGKIRILHNKVMGFGPPAPVYVLAEGAP